MREIDRRAFLRLSIGAVAGVASGTVLYVLNGLVIEGIQQTTGRRAGNVHLEDVLQEHCKSQDYSEEECFKVAKQTLEDHEATVTVVGPIIEEVAFRVFPSFVLSSVNTNEDPISTTISGRGGLLLTRRELGVGVVSTLMFAGFHNITPRGLDTEAVPLPGIITGSALWYLQRKFGFLANILAHITNNSIAIQLIKNTSAW